MDELLSHLPDVNNGDGEMLNSLAKAVHRTSSYIGLVKLQRVNL